MSIHNLFEGLSITFKASMNISSSTVHLFYYWYWFVSDNILSKLVYKKILLFFKWNSDK